MRFLVAMSGGVDSSVAAAILRDEGHEVVGVTMKLWGGERDTGCCSVADVDDARRVAQQLGIDHVVFNFADAFAERVVVPYVDAHAAGRTPNPCIECNRHLKFDRLAARADQLGFDAVATGHHARVVERLGRLHVGRGADRAKDQSYVVHVLDHAHLARTRFPVGDMTKDEVRRRAFQLGLRTAAKPESQDVCFITTGGGRRAFLAGRIDLHPAAVVDTAGRRVGEIAAVELVTVGQRKGLDLGGHAEPRYVVDVDVSTSTVTVGSGGDLLVESQAIEGVLWAAGEPARGQVRAQCSAHGCSRPAEVSADGTLQWVERQRRVAPGQAVVLYDSSDDVVLGAAVAAPQPGAPSSA